MTPSWFSRILGLGDEGPDVKVVQRRSGAVATGKFDEETEARVRGLQKMTGLEITGVVDKKTASKVGERARSALPPAWFTRRIRLWDEGEDVRAARVAFGFSPADNRWDPDAEAAARRWQSARGLFLTGEVDEAMATEIAVE